MYFDHLINTDQIRLQLQRSLAVNLESPASWFVQIEFAPPPVSPAIEPHPTKGSSRTQTPEANNLQLRANSSVVSTSPLSATSATYSLTSYDFYLLPQTISPCSQRTRHNLRRTQARNHFHHARRKYILYTRIPTPECRRNTTVE